MQKQLTEVKNTEILLAEISQYSVSIFERLLGKHELELHSHRPIAEEVRLFNIVEPLNGGIHRLTPDPKNFPESASHGNGPFLSASGFPVGRNDGGGGQVPPLGQVVVHEGLREKEVDIVIAGSCVRPEIRHQGTYDPRTGHGQGDR